MNSMYKTSRGQCWGVAAELWTVSVGPDAVENQNQKAVWCVLIQGVVLLEVQGLTVLSPDS